MSMNDFQIISKLGDGAYSVVYKVRRLSDGIQYALKKAFLSLYLGKNGTAVHKGT